MNFTIFILMFSFVSTFTLLSLWSITCRFDPMNIVASLIAGAIVASIPFMKHEKRQNPTNDVRLRFIETVKDDPDFKIYFQTNNTKKDCKWCTN